MLDSTSNINVDVYSCCWVAEIAEAELTRFTDACQSSRPTRPPTTLIWDDLIGRCTDLDVLEGDLGFAGAEPQARLAHAIGIALKLRYRARLIRQRTADRPQALRHAVAREPPFAFFCSALSRARRFRYLGAASA